MPRASQSCAPARRIILQEGSGLALSHCFRTEVVTWKSQGNYQGCSSLKSVFVITRKTVLCFLCSKAALSWLTVQFEGRSCCHLHSDHSNDTNKSDSMVRQMYDFPSSLLSSVTGEIQFIVRAQISHNLLLFWTQFFCSWQVLAKVFKRQVFVICVDGDYHVIASSQKWRKSYDAFCSLYRLQSFDKLFLGSPCCSKIIQHGLFGILLCYRNIIKDNTHRFLCFVCCSHPTELGTNKKKLASNVCFNLAQRKFGPMKQNLIYKSIVTKPLTFLVPGLWLFQHFSETKCMLILAR